MKKRRRTPQLRTAVQSDARRIHDLIQRNQQAGHLLPRQLSELTARIDRFVVAVDGRGAIIACGELAPLSSSLAEIRSLVVSEARRSEGLGRGIVGELRVRAQNAGYNDLCVFAHQPAYFAHMGFSIVPHTWLPEKIVADCRSCPLFRKCEQFAMVMDLDVTPEIQPNAQLHV
jgi:amino-acid N-acetyltransferase